MKAILFDMDGVLYVGGEAIPGAVETLAWVKEQGIPHLFLTNTTSRPRSALVEKLAGMGIEVEEASILTPVVAAQLWLERHGIERIAPFVPERTEAEFAAFHFDNEAPQALVVGDLGAGWDFATCNRAFRLLMQASKPHLIALGLTRYWRAEDGLRLDVGPYIKALEYAAGVEAVVLGKPAAAFFHTATQQLGADGSETIMIGDDIRGDIDGAQRAGLKAVQVRSGKFQPRDLELGIEPDAVIDTIADLPDWWGARSA